MKKLLGLLVVLFLLGGCIPKQLYNWGAYDGYVYAYIKSPNPESLTVLMRECEKLIEDCGSRNVPPPGLCADYGFLLIKSGQAEQGKAMLQKEIILYPESKIFIERILNRMSQ